MKYQEFLQNCTPCGGNWSAMLFTGIKAVAPELWEELPDRSFEFDELVFIVNHLCYDRPHLRFNRCIRGRIIEHTIEGKFVFRDATPEEMAMSVKEFERVYNGVTFEEPETQSVNKMDLDGDEYKEV